MTVVALTNDPVSLARAETSVTGRRAIIVVMATDDLAEQRRCARQLGISERMLLRARRVVREEYGLALAVRAGDQSLDAAEQLLSARSMTKLAGSDVLERVARRVAAVSAQAPQRALELALAEREEKLTQRDVFVVARRLGINNTAIRRARAAVAAGHAGAVRSGQRSLHDAAGKTAVASMEAPVRINAAWVGREVSRKLEAALDTLAELPLATDVAALLCDHSNLTTERLDRVINWLRELRNAL